MLTETIRNDNLFVPLIHSGDGLGNLFSQGEKSPLSTVVFLRLSKNLNASIIRTKSFMVGVLGSTCACWLLDPVYQPDTSATQSLVTFGGSLNTTVKELFMSQHNYAQIPHTQKPLTISVSDKEQSAPQKTSRFNVLDKASKHIIAYKVPFHRAMQYSHQKQTVIKFMGMFGGAA